MSKFSYGTFIVKQRKFSDLDLIYVTKNHQLWVLQFNTLIECCISAKACCIRKYADCCVPFPREIRLCAVRSPYYIPRMIIWIHQEHTYGGIHTLSSPLDVGKRFARRDDRVVLPIVGNRTMLCHNAHLAIHATKQLVHIGTLKH